MGIYSKQWPNKLHTFSAFWLRSSVASVLISVKTDILTTGGLIFTIIFLGGWISLSLPSCPPELPWTCTFSECSLPIKWAFFINQKKFLRKTNFKKLKKVDFAQRNYFFVLPLNRLKIKKLCLLLPNSETITYEKLYWSEKNLKLW